MNTLYHSYVIMFIVMVVVGMCFNPMNVLAYRMDDLYISLTLFYGGLLMASNMVWAHEIVHYLSYGNLNIFAFVFGIILSVGVAFILRKQLFVDDTQWLKRMISHHSTALTTSHIIYKRTRNPEIRKLSEEIIETQEKEIERMKELLN